MHDKTNEIASLRALEKVKKVLDFLVEQKEDIKTGVVADFVTSLDVPENDEQNADDMNLLASLCDVIQSMFIRRAEAIKTDFQTLTVEQKVQMIRQMLQKLSNVN